MNKIKKIQLFFLFPILALNFLFFTQSVHADSPSTDMDVRLVEKAMYQGLYRCYTEGRMAEFKSLSQLSSVASLTKSGGPQYIYLPTGSTGVSDDNLNCRQLFTGGDWNIKFLGFTLWNGGTFEGIFSWNQGNAFINTFGEIQTNTQVANYFDSLTTDEKKSFLEKMGYTVSREEDTDDSEPTAKTCFKIKYHISATATSDGYDSINEDTYTDTICEMSDGSFETSNTVSAEYGIGVSLSPYDDDGFLIGLDPNSWMNADLDSRNGLYKELVVTYDNTNSKYCAHEQFDKNCVKEITSLTPSSINELIKTKMIGTTSSFTVTYGYVNEGYDNGATISNISVVADKSDDESSEYVVGSDYSANIKEYISAAYTAISNLSDGYMGEQGNEAEAQANIGYTEAEKFAMYSGYIRDVYGLAVDCSDANSDIGGVEQIPYYENGSFNICYVDINASTNKNARVRGVDELGWIEKSANLTLEDVIAQLNEIDTENLELSEDDKSILDDEMSNQDPNNTEVSKDPCWNADLDSMAWILCPAESNLEDTASALDNTVQSWLQVDTEFYDSESSTHIVWEVMRNIANVAMIMILFVVIASQVTGVGIDNYGIKKILPQLMIMAVLINLSFLICQAAIDLSNIFGVGIRDLLKDMGNAVINMEGKEVNAAELGIGYIITAIFALAGIAGASSSLVVATTEAALLGNGPMVVIIILLALITIIVAVVLFFLALGTRMLIIITCIIVSPLAFVCCILPNTKNLYKQWWRLFESALVIFPVCSALSGASYLLKAIILTTSGIHLWMLIVALVAPYLVFFLLPSLLKKSIAGLGAIGGALTTMGDKFKSNVSSGTKAAKDAFQKTDTYKDIQAEGMRRQMQRKLDHLNAIESSGKGLSDAQRRRRNALIGAISKDKQELYNAQYGPQSVLLSDEQAQANAVAERTASEINLAKQDGGLMTESIFGIDPTSETASFEDAGAENWETKGLAGAINFLNSGGGNASDRLAARTKIQEYTKEIAATKDGVTTLARLTNGKSGAGYGALASAIKNNDRVAANVKKYGNSDLHDWVQKHANASGTATYKNVNGETLAESGLDTRRISMINQLCGDVNSPNSRGSLSTSDFVSQAGGTIAENANLAEQLRNHNDLGRLGFAHKADGTNTAEHQADVALERMQQTAYDALLDSHQQSNIDQGRAANMARILSDNQLEDIFTDPDHSKYNATILSAAENELIKRKIITQ